MTWRNEPDLLGTPEQTTGEATLWFTTNAGLEDIVADELCERLTGAGIDTPVRVQRRPLGCRGNVIVRLSATAACPPDRMQSQVEAMAGRLRSVHHVVRPLYGFSLPEADHAQLDFIAQQLTARGVPCLTATGTTFRVSTRRTGEHGFTSMDVQRRAGAALVGRYGLDVNLLEPDCEVRVDVINDRCLVGVQLTDESLSRRKQRHYNPRGALKSNVAYALLRFAGNTRGRVLDPFCGSATIAIEAAREYPGLAVECSDYSPKAVAGATGNVADAGFSDRIKIHCRNIFELPEHYAPGTFDSIVTNPPFGVHIGRGMNFHNFYQGFFDSAAHVLKPGGKLVFLAWKRGIVDRANRVRRQFRRAHVRVVETGGIYPRVYVYERLPA